jgi:hypothetical protein
MKRLVKLNQGSLELDMRTYRNSGMPRILRRTAFPAGYQVTVTRYGSDGWSVGDPEDPQGRWAAGAGSKLSSFLVDFAGMEPDEAEKVATETIAEWKRQDPDAPA